MSAPRSRASSPPRASTALCVPASLGGGEAPPRELLGAIEALATGDGAAGWCVAVCATAGMLAAYLEPERAAEVYGNPDAVAGGVFAPSGRASADGDKLTVSGRWRFASNVANCDWLMGGCVVHDGERPRSLESGRPDVRLVLMPAAAVEVIDTWSVSGLRATGSHDIAVDGLELPAARSASLITDSPREPGPLYAFPPFGLLAAAIAAVALGIARGALDDLGALAGAKTPTLSTRKLAERAATQSGLARAEAALGGSRALLLESGRSCLGRRAGRWRDPDRSPGAPAAGRDPRCRELGRRGRPRLVARRRQRDLRDRPARSAASATSTPRPSTCWSLRRPGSSPGARCSGSSSTPRSSEAQPALS